jgi:hypothetical protein
LTYAGTNGTIVVQLAGTGKGTTKQEREDRSQDKIPPASQECPLLSPVSCLLTSDS